MKTITTMLMVMFSLSPAFAQTTGQNRAEVNQAIELLKQNQCTVNCPAVTPAPKPVARATPRPAPKPVQAVVVPPPAPTPVPQPIEITNNIRMELPSEFVSLVRSLETRGAPVPVQVNNLDQEILAEARIGNELDRERNRILERQATSLRNANKWLAANTFVNGGQLAVGIIGLKKIDGVKKAVSDNTDSLRTAIAVMKAQARPEINLNQTATNSIGNISSNSSGNTTEVDVEAHGGQGGSGGSGGGGGNATGGNGTGTGTGTGGTGNGGNGNGGNGGGHNPPPPPPPPPPSGGGHGNNGVGNGQDPQPPGNPKPNDGPGTSPGNPGNQGGKK